MATNEDIERARVRRKLAKQNVIGALRTIPTLISALREAQGSLTREDPKSRHLSLAITDLESAENWLNRPTHVFEPHETEVRWYSKEAP